MKSILLLSAFALCAFGGFTQAHQTDMSAKTALYHQQGKQPIELHVLETHPDKTVDLGLADKTIVVSKCEVMKEARPGCCTFVTSEKPAKAPAAAPKPDLKSLRANARKLTDAAEKATKAADAAKGDPNEEELMKVALAAQEAAAEAGKLVTDAEGAANQT